MRNPGQKKADEILHSFHGIEGSTRLCLMGDQKVQFVFHLKKETMLNTLCVVVFFCVSYLVSAGVITTRQPESKEYNSTIRQYSTGTINRQRSTFEPENTHNITLCNDGIPTEVLLGDQTSVTVRSPNFGDGDYPPNSRCKVVFRTGEKAMMVLLQFNAFDLELAMDFDSCDYDWLCVNGVKFCGDWASNRIFEYLIPEENFHFVFFYGRVCC
ncbi:hypothetical protein Btru_077162 [Bulinus truncatus]|nr:hypothetical protein Btru_077162 [Bulinus truncatus]